jgi:hypothetical protein
MYRAFLVACRCMVPLIGLAVGTLVLTRAEHDVQRLGIRIPDPTLQIPRPITLETQLKIDVFEALFKNMNKAPAFMKLRNDSTIQKQNAQLQSTFLAAAAFSEYVYDGDRGVAKLDLVSKMPSDAFRGQYPPLFFEKDCCTATPLQRALRGWQLSGSRVLPQRQHLTLAWYVNKDLRHVLVAFKGSSHLWDFFQDAVLASTEQGLLSVDAAVYLLADSMFPVQNFVQRNFTVSFTGHSLGAVLAEQCACVFGSWAVTFDSPGSGGQHYLHPRCRDNMGLPSDAFDSSDLNEYGEPFSSPNSHSHVQWRTRWDPLSDSNITWDSNAHIFSFLSNRLHVIHALNKQWGKKTFVSGTNALIPEGLPIFFLGAWIYLCCGLIPLNFVGFHRDILSYMYRLVFLLSPAMVSVADFKHFYLIVFNNAFKYFGIDPWFWMCWITAAIQGIIMFCIPVWNRARSKPAIWSPVPVPTMLSYSASFSFDLPPSKPRSACIIVGAIIVGCGLFIGVYGVFWIVHHHSIPNMVEAIANHGLPNEYGFRKSTLSGGVSSHSFVWNEEFHPTVSTVMFSLWWYLQFGVAAAFHIDGYWKSFPLDPSYAFWTPAVILLSTIGAGMFSVILLQPLSVVSGCLALVGIIFSFGFGTLRQSHHVFSSENMKSRKEEWLTLLRVFKIIVIWVCLPLCFMHNRNEIVIFMLEMYSQERLQPR